MHNSGFHGQAPSVDTDKVSSISCYYTNTQSLYHKIPELQKVIDERSIKIVGITETWANVELSDGELHIEGFNTYRCDRTNEQKWGECLCTTMKV